MGISNVNNYIYNLSQIHKKLLEIYNILNEKSLDVDKLNPVRLVRLENADQPPVYHVFVLEFRQKLGLLPKNWSRQNGSITVD